MIEIRPAQLADAEDLTRCCFPRNTVEQTRADLRRALELADRGDGASLVAVVDDEIVGNVTLARGEHRMRRHRADLGGFVINPVAQGNRSGAAHGRGGS